MHARTYMHAYIHREGTYIIHTYRYKMHDLSTRGHHRSAICLYKAKKEKNEANRLIIDKILSQSDLAISIVLQRLWGSAY